MKPSRAEKSVRRNGPCKEKDCWESEALVDYSSDVGPRGAAGLKVVMISPVTTCEIYDGEFQRQKKRQRRAGEDVPFHHGEGGPGVGSQLRRTFLKHFPL